MTTTTLAIAMKAKLTRSAKMQRVFVFLLVSLAGFAAIAPRSSHPVLAAGAAGQSKPARIISVIPAVTEMLFAIGAGPQVVGVGSFDEYPEEARKLPRVGALLDPDLERILALRPDLVVVYESQADFRRQLERASVPTFVYKHAGLADVTQTITALGTRIGREKEASAVVTTIETRLKEIRSRVQGQPRPLTLLVFGRDAQALRGIYASGGVGFLSDMLEAAGGSNVFADVARQSIQATTELILARRPEVIIELRAQTIAPQDLKQGIEAWQVLSSVPAVRTGRIVVVADPRTVVPGPRVAEGTELLARALHPDAFSK
jgi:iron complex transport system substrate-binding protein